MSELTGLYIPPAKGMQIASGPVGVDEYHAEDLNNLLIDRPEKLIRRGPMLSSTVISRWWDYTGPIPLALG
jgi:hypothetical protein